MHITSNIVTEIVFAGSSLQSRADNSVAHKEALCKDTCAVSVFLACPCTVEAGRGEVSCREWKRVLPFRVSSAFLRPINAALTPSFKHRARH